MPSTTQVEAASQSLAFRISDLEEQGAQAGSNLNGTLGEIFRADDKLLANLQKLGWELEQPDPDETSKLDKLREICSRLAACVPMFIACLLTAKLQSGQDYGADHPREAGHDLHGNARGS